MYSSEAYKVQPLPMKWHSFVFLNNQLICSLNQFMGVQIYISDAAVFSSPHFTASPQQVWDPDQTGHGCQTCICISRVQKDGPPNHWQEMLWVYCITWLITSQWTLCFSLFFAFFFRMWYYKTSLQVLLYLFDYPNQISERLIWFWELLFI